MPAHDSVATHCTRVILAALVALALSPAPVTAARPPAVLFTDVPSGPVSGGIRGAGAPLAIFGTGFGATRGSSTVTIGGIEVAAYLVWGSRNAHNETLDLIVVEPGPAVSGGAVVVTVDGQASTPGVTFTAAAGEVFVVAPDGNDAATCRVDAPCRRIGVVATSRMQPGDVLLVRGGEYDEGEVWLRDEYGHSGTALRPKVIRRYPGEEPLFSNAARPIILDANHIVISGLRFANGKSIGIGSNERGRTGVHVVDASFEGVIAWDAIGTHGDDHVLAGNVCRVSGSTVGTQGHCYYISFGRGVRLLHNIGSGAPGYGIHVFDQRRQAQDFTRTIADLVIEGNIVSGSTLRSGMILSMADESGLGNAIDGVVVRNNVLVGNNHLGLTINGIVRNVQVLNNTFSRNGRQGLYVASQATVNGVTVQNNLFDEGPNTACTSNCSWYQPAHVEVGGLAQSVSLGRNYYSGGTPMVIGGVDTAPVTGSATFLDAAAFDFRPAGGSVVVDAGLTLTAVVRDYTGLSRPRGAAFDLGAFEYVADDVPPPPGAALALTGSVSGRAVTIAWTASGGASSGPVDLEARSRPNGWVVATTRAPASPLVVAGVPDGAYYVRIASAGPAGTVVSNQVRVVVGTTCEPPDTPAAFAASVSGNVVSLRWTLAGPTATTVELAVGYAPGATDLGPIAVGTAPLAVAAPPARYFVRARARNGCGVSPFTSDAEVRVGV